MTNELVKEIEDAEKIAQEQIDEYSKRILGFADGDNESRCNEWRYVLNTLQRAREALRWIPVEEWRQGSHESDIYEVTIAEDGKDGDVYQRHLLYWKNTEKIFSDFDGEQEITSLEVIAVKPASLPYTPEEK